MINTVSNAMTFSSLLKIKTTLEIPEDEAKRELEKSAIIIDGLVQSLLIAEESITKIGQASGIPTKSIEDILKVIDKPHKTSTTQLSKVGFEHKKEKK